MGAWAAQSGSNCGPGSARAQCYDHPKPCPRALGRRGWAGRQRTLRDGHASQVHTAPVLQQDLRARAYIYACCTHHGSRCKIDCGQSHGILMPCCQPPRLASIQAGTNSTSQQHAGNAELEYATNRPCSIRRDMSRVLWQGPAAPHLHEAATATPGAAQGWGSETPWRALGGPSPLRGSAWSSPFSLPLSLSRTSTSHAPCQSSADSSWRPGARRPRSAHCPAPRQHGGRPLSLVCHLSQPSWTGARSWLLSPCPRRPAPCHPLRKRLCLGQRRSPSKR
jgi:hypothetical protein